VIQGRTSRPIDCIERLDGLNFMLFLSYTYRQAPTGVKYYAVIKVVQVGLAYNSVKEERGRGREGREGRERGSEGALEPPSKSLATALHLVPFPR